jgi:ABC-type antimicrobial peptide transport system permease subunit
MKFSIFRENLRISFRAIRSNRLRAILTMCIIAFGIMALVGILTAIDAIKSSLTNQFTMMGANSFTITSRGMNIHIGNDSYRARIIQGYRTGKQRNSGRGLLSLPGYPFHLMQQGYQQ